MNYFRTAAFKKAWRGLGRERQEKAEETLLKLAEALEGRLVIQGLGLKPLRRGLWEARSGIHDRIIFRRRREVVEFFLIGSHDEVVKFLKNS